MPAEQSNKKATAVEQPANGHLDTKLLLSTLVAVKNGDFSVRLPVEWTGINGKIADAFNDIIEVNAKMAKELERVSKVVGKEGRLTQRASLGSGSGAWTGMIESVNSLVSDLVQPTNEMARVIGAVARGDLSQTLALEVEGRPLQGDVLSTAKTVNAMVEQLGAFTAEVTRVAREVGTEGKLGGQAKVKGVAGTWKDLTDSVNSMAGNLTAQVRNIADVTKAVANGDLSKKITVDVKGEFLELKNTVNTMVDQLRAFSAEVTRVAREVGSEGILGGQARVEGVSGVWADLTDNVNFMASNLTTQVRNIADVTTAVANGDLTRKITVDARGEVAALADTINTMVDQLSSFADEVTRVAREVGTEGQLGGQAEVEGVSGTWRRLTENVNQLAGNLTTQIRAIKDVSTAVIQGDLTRQITVAASGEVSTLNDTINQMIANLRDTTQQNAEQDWLKTNLARITGAIQGQRDLAAVSRLIMSEVTPLVDAQHGAFFLNVARDEKAPAELRMIASYGYQKRKNLANQFTVGEGLVGQAALEGKSILVANAPPDYIRVTSGLGEALPVNLIVLPIQFEDQVLSVIELASVHPISETNQ